MKLSPHIINGSETARRIAIDGKAPAVKLVRAYDKGGEYAAAGLLVTARHALPNDDKWREYIGAPAAYYDEWIRPHLEHQANQAVTAWETGVNEDGPRKIHGTETPDAADMRLRGDFEATIARMIAAGGKQPIVGNFSVGMPSGEREEQRHAWRAYLSALRAAVECGGYVGIHAYANIDGWEHPIDTLFQVADESGLSALRVIITETGVEPGWRSWIDQNRYAGIMIECDRILSLRYGDRVAAAMVYQFGDSEGRWSSYNLDGADEWAQAVITYGQMPPAPQKPPAPPDERPLFTFPGSGLKMNLYSSPGGNVTGQRFARWPVDVFEVRGQWWRVTRGEAGRWVRMRFD